MVSFEELITQLKREIVYRAKPIYYGKTDDYTYHGAAVILYLDNSQDSIINYHCSDGVIIEMIPKSLEIQGDFLRFNMWRKEDPYNMRHVGEGYMYPKFIEDLLTIVAEYPPIK